MLESLGKFCFSHRRPFLFYLFLFLPIFFATLYAFMQAKKTKHFEDLVLSSCKKGKLALIRKKQKEQFIHCYSNANPYFLDTNIESILFSKHEIDELTAILQHPAITDKKQIEARLNFLTKGANHLSFTEESIRTTGTIKETEEKQRHPVQMDEEDLRKLLTIVEDMPIAGQTKIEASRPQIVITDFRLDTKQTPLKTNVFEVEMQFLKREFEQ